MERRNNDWAKSYGANYERQQGNSHKPHRTGPRLASQSSLHRSDLIGELIPCGEMRKLLVHRGQGDLNAAEPLLQPDYSRFHVSRITAAAAFGKWAQVVNSFAPCLMFGLRRHKSIMQAPVDSHQGMPALAASSSAVAPIAVTVFSWSEI